MSPVHIIGAGPLAAAIVAAVRAAVPTRVVAAHETPPGSSVLARSAFIVGVAGADVAALYRLNRVACAATIPFLPICLASSAIHLGPTVIPGVTACFLCAALRLAASPNPVPAPPLHFLGMEGGPGGEVPRFAAHEILYTLLGEPSPARGRLGILAADGDGGKWHPVLRHPRCPACGDLPWHPAEPMADPLAAFVDDEVGIVQTVLPLPPAPAEPEPPHAALAVLTNTQFRDDWETLPPGDQTASGKGWTAEEARRAAVGEALERYCAMLPPASNAFPIGPRAALGGAVIGPEAFGLYHNAQYADGSVPFMPVTDDTPLHWVAGRSLTHDRDVFVPASLVFLLPLDPFCPQNSSGLAVGTSYARAALRALCEVIERDAFLTAWLTMHAAPLLDLAIVGPRVARLAHHYAGRGVTLTAHDLTRANGVPVVLARAHDEWGRPPIDLIGLGCDPDPIRAVERAVLEVVQGRRARWDELAREGAPDTIRTPSDHARWYALADRSAAFTFLDAQPGPLPAPVGRAEDDADTSLAAVVARLAAADHEAIIVDITTPDVRASGMVVVRALVTGLVPIHFGVGRERLAGTYLAGYRADNLNPAPHPLA